MDGLGWLQGLLKLAPCNGKLSLVVKVGGDQACFIQGGLPWMAGWLPAWLASRLDGWLSGWPAAWLAGWQAAISLPLCNPPLLIAYALPLSQLGCPKPHICVLHGGGFSVALGGNFEAPRGGPQGGFWRGPPSCPKTKFPPPQKCPKTFLEGSKRDPPF